MASVPNEDYIRQLLMKVFILRVIYMIVPMTVPLKMRKITLKNFKKILIRNKKERILLKKQLTISPSHISHLFQLYLVILVRIKQPNGRFTIVVQEL